MADFRDYIGMDTSTFLVHYGVGHLQGGHSGRFPWGSGENGGGATRSARDRYKTARTNYRTAKKALRNAEDRRDRVNNSELSSTSDKRTADRDVLRRERALDKAEVEYRNQKARYKEARASEKEERRQNRETEREARQEEKERRAEERPHRLLSRRLSRKEDNLKNISNKEIGKLSDKELNDRINRLRQEDTYRQLIGQKTLGQVRRDNDKAQEIAKETMEDLVRSGLNDLVGKVIVPTATGHMLYSLAQGKVNRENAEIREYNAKHPNDKKALKSDIDYVSTVFKTVKQKDPTKESETPFTQKQAQRIIKGIQSGKGTPDDIKDWNILLNQLASIEKMAKGGGKGK